MVLTQATFPVVSKYPRLCEPVSIAVPVPEGVLTDPCCLALVDDGRPVPTQVEVTSRWRDGSVRWALCHALVDLPGLAQRTFDIAVLDEPAALLDSPLSVELRVDGWQLDTGSLKLSLSPWQPGGDLLVGADGEAYQLLGGESETLQDGPVRWVGQVTGQLVGPVHGLRYRTRLTAWAHRPEVEVEFTLIQATDQPVLNLERVAIWVVVPPVKAPRVRLAQGNYRTSMKTLADGVADTLVIDANEVMFSGNEQTDELFHSDVFADWSAGQTGLTVTLFQAYQQFPKALTAGPDGIFIELLPRLDDGTGPIPFLQGMAKTHRFQLRWHAADEPEEETIHRSLQYQMPDQPTLPLAAYQNAKVFTEPVFPVALSKRLERYANSLGDNRCRAYGWLHWGDGPDWGYTQQGRGRGKLVWNNNEYDLPHVAFMHYAWSGERRFRAMAEVAAQHWIDVDIVHHHSDPNRIGGQVIHSADHVSGGISPCHEWVEGLLDYHHFTGRPEALEAAEGIAAQVLGVLERTPSLHQPGASAARVTGWALRSLLAMYGETFDEKYLDPCHGIVDNFVAWHEQYGGFLAPYHSHTLARVPFMISIACGSLIRYHRVTGDERIAELVPHEMRAVIETCLGRDGLFVYKDIPSLHRRGAGFYVLEALAAAYELSGEAWFLEVGLPTLREQLSGGGRTGFTAGREHVPAEQCVVFGHGQGPKRYASEWLPLMTYYHALSVAGMLEETEG